MCWGHTSGWRLVSCVVAAICLCAPSAAAQERQTGPEPRTRQEVLDRQREAKAADATAYEPGWLERWLVKVERDPTPEDLFRRSDGFYLQAPSITTGDGIAVGPAFRSSGLFGDRLDVNARLVGSQRKYWLGEVDVSMPRLADGWVFATVSARKQGLPQEDFYGLGVNSVEADRVDFAYRDTAVGGTVGVHLGPLVSVGTGLERIAPRVGRGRDSRFPSIEEVFDETDAPGLSARPTFLRYHAFADLDFTNPVGNPTTGGNYHVSYSYYDDLNESRFRFSRVDIDLRHYISILKRRRVLALHAVGSFSGDTGADRDIPFYLLPTLGGSRTLRGEADFRFRDRHLLLLQAEYRWNIFPAVDAAIFYDVGKVASRREDINLRNLDDDYGFGIRLGTVDGVFFRVDTAFGGRDGDVRLFIKFGNVF